MITTLIHYDAVFEIDGRYSYAPVIAWSEGGDALVVDEFAGRLVEARSLAGFTQVSQNPHRSTKGASGSPEFKGTTGW